MFIPEKITVGFQKRNDTYTGKLAYVIYKDEKGVLRQESSWNGWRDQKIEPIEYDNKPTNFILNKGIKRDGYYGSGRSVIRIFDTREFEFEISVDNLMAVLMHSDVSKRDIQEQCVFAWSGKNLVLLTVNSAEYEEAVKFTEKQNNKFSMKDLELGYYYELKKEKKSLMYVGHYEYFEADWSKKYSYKGKQHVFYEEKDKKFIALQGKDIYQKSSEDLSSDFSNIVEKFINSKNHKNKSIKWKLSDKFSHTYYKKIYDNEFYQLNVSQNNNKFHISLSKINTCIHNNEISKSKVTQNYYSYQLNNEESTILNMLKEENIYTEEAFNSLMKKLKFGIITIVEN